MKDEIICGTLKEYPVRFYIATTTETVQTMNRIHDTTPVAAAAAGRILTAAAIMGAMMKNEQDFLTVTVKGDGEIGRVTATANAASEVKCEILNPHTGVYFNEKGKLDVGKIVGSGTLCVIRDIGLKQPYVGQVELVSGEIAEDIAYYYVKSEQIPSVVALGVFVRKDLTVVASGGYFIQLMPGCDESIITYLEEKAASLPSVTSMMLEGCDAAEIANRIFCDYEYEVMKTNQVRYVCNCSESKIEKMLMALGREELQSIIDDGETIEVLCHFCNKKYLVTVEQIRELMTLSRE